ncbi:MAG: diaminopimelate epimerase, partial [Myxococcota bacterium]|nr:diaminopimelate epimerase [Myxococcota bacterium]
MEFIKYHGLGNDFILLKGGLNACPSPTTDEVLRLCHRRLGIGADGLLLARPSTQADLRMEIINSDGSVPEMCGNGIRCLVKFAVEELGMASNPLSVETAAGTLSCAWTAAGGEVQTVQVAMGGPDFQRSAVHLTGEGDAIDVPVRWGEQLFSAVGVSMGNPHMVIFTASPLEDACRHGEELSSHPDWGAGAN